MRKICFILIVCVSIAFFLTGCPNSTIQPSASSTPTPAPGPDIKVQASLGQDDDMGVMLQVYISDGGAPFSTATVTLVNGVDTFTVPFISDGSASSWYLCMDAGLETSLGAGDVVTLTVTAPGGISITRTGTFPGLATFISPTGTYGSPTQVYQGNDLPVTWLAANPAPQHYTFWIYSPGTVDPNYDPEVLPPATSFTFPGGTFNLCDPVPPSTTRYPIGIYLVSENYQVLSGQYLESGSYFTLNRSLASVYIDVMAGP
jgi:hypothetical protein